MFRATPGWSPRRVIYQVGAVERAQTAASDMLGAHGKVVRWTNRRCTAQWSRWAARGWGAGLWDDARATDTNDARLKRMSPVDSRSSACRQ